MSLQIKKFDYKDIDEVNAFLKTHPEVNVSFKEIGILVSFDAADFLQEAKRRSLMKACDGAQNEVITAEIERNMWNNLVMLKRGGVEKQQEATNGLMASERSLEMKQLVLRICKGMLDDFSTGTITSPVDVAPKKSTVKGSK